MPGKVWIIMSLSYVQAAVATVALFIATWSSLLIALSLLLPKQSRKAEAALESAPLACFFGGLGVAIFLIISIILFNIPNPIAKFLGFMMTLGLSGILALGSSGIAHLMGKRIGEMSKAKTSFGMLVRGSIVFSMALGFPYIGWFLFGPIAILMSFGAGAAALLPSRQTASPPTIPPHPTDYDVMERQGAV